MFFELSIKKLVKHLGQICFITPRFYLVNKDDYEMRKAFLNELKINFLSTCNPFENVVTENVITMITLTKADANIPVFVYEAKKRIFVETFPIDIHYCNENRFCEILVGISPEIINLLNTMKRGTTPLSAYIDSKRGAEISKTELRRTTSGVKSLIGKDVKKYQILWDNTYINVNLPEYQRLKDFFPKPMIYLRRVDNCLEASYSETGYAFNKNIYGLAQKTDSQYSLLYLLAILNSTAATYYYRHRFSMKKDDTFPEIQTYLYEQLPIPSASIAVRRIVEHRVYQLLHSTEPSSQAIKELDSIIYDLYGLSSLDILLIENDMMTK